MSTCGNESEDAEIMTADVVLLNARPKTRDDRRGDEATLAVVDAGAVCLACARVRS